MARVCLRACMDIARSATSWALLAIVPCVAVAHGQGSNPWAGTLSTSHSPLAVGECSVVYIKLTDETGKDWPRGPNGARVAMADFDLAVSAPASYTAVGVYDGSNNYSVCACPKAVPGSVATITATYPSKWIAPKARAPGVSFAISTSTPIVAGSSGGNPPGCDAGAETSVASAGGSATWNVALQPPALLPIGSCGRVSMTLRDSTGKEWPRNQAGTRVSMADFDVTVKAANGADVAGRWVAFNNYSACACQSGSVGERATVTATYPAQALPSSARAPGMSLTASAPFTLAAARGSADPAGCGARQASVATVGASTRASSSASATAANSSSITTLRAGGRIESVMAAGEYEPPGMTGAPPRQTKNSTQGAQTGAALGQTSGAKLGKAGVIPAPIVNSTGASSRGTKPGVVLLTNATAVPMGVEITATPLVAHLSWTGTASAKRYDVIRQDGSGNPVTRTPSGFTSLQLDDSVPSLTDLFTYTVVAYYAGELKADSSPPVQFKSPALANPPKFSATDQGNGTVHLDWHDVVGVIGYRVNGTAVPSGGLYTTATTLTVTQVPTGRGSWNVTAVYPGNVADYSTATVATAMVNSTARPGKP